MPICSFRWLDEDTPDPDAIKLADIMLRAGMQQLPNNPYMILLYSSFLIDVQGSYQSGYGQLQAAKKADPRQAVSCQFHTHANISYSLPSVCVASWRTLPSSAVSKSTLRRRVGRKTEMGQPTL